MSKLVRDRIPEIIRETGKTPIIERCEDNKALFKLLTDKLYEEVEEFVHPEDGEHDISELADILEVVYALGNQLGFSEDEINNVRLTKAATNGKFNNGYVFKGIWSCSNE